jgi:hypothetical protein
MLVNPDGPEAIATIERLSAELERVKAIVVREYEFAKKAEQQEGSNPYREGAADTACDIMNAVCKVVDAALNNTAENR